MGVPCDQPEARCRRFVAMGLAQAQGHTTGAMEQEIGGRVRTRRCPNLLPATDVSAQNHLRDRLPAWGHTDSTGGPGVTEGELRGGGSDQFPSLTRPSEPLAHPSI